MPEFINPGVPFDQPMPAGFPMGGILEIFGMVDCNAQSFSVDLVCNEGIAFTLKPRFTPAWPKNEVARNSLLNGSWGVEENTGGTPFQKGKPFMLKIKNEGTKYRILVNGEDIFTYNCRFLEFEKIKIVKVHGDLKLTSVQF